MSGEYINLLDETADMSHTQQSCLISTLPARRQRALDSDCAAGIDGRWQWDIECLFGWSFDSRSRTAGKEKARKYLGKDDFRSEVGDYDCSIHVYLCVMDSEVNYNHM